MNRIEARGNFHTPDPVHSQTLEPGLRALETKENLMPKIDELSIFGEYGKPENRLTVALLQVPKEVRRRLKFLCDVGLEYLALDRAAPCGRDGGPTDKRLIRSDDGWHGQTCLPVLSVVSIESEKR